MSLDRDDENPVDSEVGSDAESPKRSGSSPVASRGAGKDAGTDAATASAMPTGKAGRGSTATVARRDADEPEDTRTPRANPITYLRQVVEELRKVIWPTRSQMVTYTIVVFLFLIFMTALVASVDYGAGKLVELVFGT